MKIGTAKYGFTQKKYVKLKDGSASFRILPPIGELADSGKWSVFHAIHYGYKNTKGKLRVFISPEVVNRTTRMIEVADAANDRIKMLKGELEKAKAAGNKAAVEKIGPLVSGQKPMYNLDKNHYMNAIDTQGNIVVLKLRHKAKQALDTQIKMLRDKGVDPLSVDNGRFFTFTRTGNALDTAFAVAVTQETLNVPNVGEVKRDIVHKLDEAIIGRLKEEAAELGKLFRTLTSEEVERIVKTSDLLTGKSSTVDEIFDTKPDGTDTSGQDETDETADEAPATTSSAAPAQAAPAAPAPVAAQPATPVQAAPVATPAPAQAAPAAAPAATVVSNPTQTTSEQLGSMTDADFLKSIGM